MNIKQRIDLLVRLGEYFTANDDGFQQVKAQANLQNPWFTIEFIDTAVKNVTGNFLSREKLQDWVLDYPVKNAAEPVKTIGIVMAGNIPLVGFHDLLCVFISGHRAMVKSSSKDEVLIKHIAAKLYEWNNETARYISFADILKNCDAYIATGSNNSSRYFEYYFGKYPNIIRRNKTSVAVLEGNETEEELLLLAHDIQVYFGLGCRNVTKLFAPEGYDFIPLLQALKAYDYFMDLHKYKNNYDYQLALLILNQQFYMTNGSIILTCNESLFSPVSRVHYEFYQDKNLLREKLLNDTNIQCIAGHGFVPFGKTQSPGLSDYADGADTMQFLNSTMLHSIEN